MRRPISRLLSFARLFALTYPIPHLTIICIARIVHLLYHFTFALIMLTLSATDSLRCDGNDHRLRLAVIHVATPSRGLSLRPNLSNTTRMVYLL